jgi:hypothetical protein
MRFGLDVPVEKRRVKDRAAITFDLEYPPNPRNVDACTQWAQRTTWEICASRPGRIPGPVKMTLVYEERSGRRIFEDLAEPIINLCVKHGVIDSDHRNTLREVNAKWGNVRGVRITIEPATQILRAA